MAVCAIAALAAAGCQTAREHNPTPLPQPAAAALPVATGTQPTNSTISTNSGKPLVLQEGDTIRIAFPGAPNMDTTQSIRRDGKISLEMIGEYVAAGKTPTAVEEELKKLYRTQLVDNEVQVSVPSSGFVIYVIGAVGRPGKLVSERWLTPLQALIESGIDDTRSNLKKIEIIRTDETGHVEKFKLNLYKVLHKKDQQMPTFALKPYDIIRVPERFSFY